MVEKANLPYSKKLKIAIALQLILNTRDFEQGLATWYSKTDGDKTWKNLETHL